MHLSTEAIVCAVLGHGEHSAVARLLTPRDGLRAGYVRGGRSRRTRSVLIAGNVVQAEYRARTEEQLPALSVELLHSRAPLHVEALPAAAIDWATALAAVSLPEGQPYPGIHAALDGLLSAVEAAPSARGWATALVRYELLLLSELGFGLDLSACVATGARDDLRYVSPRSGGAVCGEAGALYAARLLRLPPFLRGGSPSVAGAAGWGDIFDGLALTAHFLARDVLVERRAGVLAARERLIERLRRIAG